MLIKANLAPNGASLRPISPYQQHLVSRLCKGLSVVVYSVPAGKQLHLMHSNLLKKRILIAT